jgi:catechol 2,3-dioxygenase-like lactoylglutathione lyase family enzyme
MDRAVRFYTEVLELELIRREGRDWTELALGGVTLALAGELAVAPQPGGATVVLRAGDIEALEGRLADHGVQRGKIEEMGAARTLEFYDPDGNQLVAIQPDAA